jgi:catechol 2,3-dioxygenase
MTVTTEHLATEFDLNAAPMRIGRVRLKVRDLAGVSGFYQDALGLVPVGQSAERIVLGVSGKPLLELVGDSSLAPLDRREAGLFHTAFLLPDRANLAHWLGFITRRRVRLLGAADHRVSEAIYLADPEGNGIEVYADRPVADWRAAGGQLDMPSNPLDLQALLAAGSGGTWAGMPAGSVIGHVHLQVGDTAAAERFYRDLLGFEVTCRYPGGSFFGAGGYHHQLAANTWNSRGAGPRPNRMAGLHSVELVVRDAATRSAIETRAQAVELHHELDGDGSVLRDPWGTVITLVSG